MKYAGRKNYLFEAPNVFRRRGEMTDQEFLLHKDLRIKLDKDRILKTCWDIEADRTLKYVCKFPNSPRTFQWSVGESQWIAKRSIDKKVYGMFLYGSGKDTIDLCLVGEPKSCVIWDIGFDFTWKWRRNPSVENDLDIWLLRCIHKIHLIEDALNNSIEHCLEPVLD